MQKGAIILFFKHKDVVLGVCLEEKGPYLRVLCEDGKEVKLNLNRITYTSSFLFNPIPRAETLIRKIQNHSEFQRTIMKRVDSNELWTHLDGNGKLYEVRMLSEAVFGDAADFDHDAAVIRALMKDRIYFKLQGSRFQARTREDVEKRTIQIKEELRRQNEIEDGASWLISVVSGKEILCANRDVHINLLKEFVVFGRESSRFRDTCSMISQAGIHGPQECFDLLADLGIWDSDENILLDRHHIPNYFSKDVLEQAASIEKSRGVSPAHDASREDLTHLHVFSIDERFTKDIDDALSFREHEGFLELGIHITDVASFIPPDSPLDREAARRASSLYLPEGKIPMFPVSLSENVLSLEEGKARSAVSLLIKLTPAGELIGHRAVKSVITVEKKMSYNDADEAIETRDEFAKLYALACLLREKRMSSGASGVVVPELQVRVDRNKEVFFKLRKREAKSQVVVSECMILANFCASLLFKEKRFPTLFRKQKAPSHKAALPETPTLFHLLRYQRNFSRVFVDVYPGFHSSLGLSSYVSITSPLRKYLDLVTQRQLVSFIQEEAPYYGKKDLKNIAFSTQSSLTRGAIVRQERKRYWLLKELQKKTGEALDALVLDMQFRGCTVVLPEYLLDVYLNIPEALSIAPGDTVPVVIEKVDPFERSLKVRFAGEE